MMEEHTRVILTEAVENVDGVMMQPGDVGVIVDVGPNHEGYIVDFIAVEGVTFSTAPVLPSQIRPVTPHDVLHARVMKESPAKVG